jgi:rare lipoprotein A
MVEHYDPNTLTATSRTLPIGSSVVVTNPATGRSVKVRINDRGPMLRAVAWISQSAQQKR